MLRMVRRTITSLSLHSCMSGHSCLSAKSRWSARSRRISVALQCLSWLLVAGLGGCGRSESGAGRYQTVLGVVAGRWTDTGRMSVRVVRGRGESRTEQEIECVVTADSELYLNERFAGLSEVSVDDKVQVFGYFDRTDARQFWVTLAYVTRQKEPAPFPRLAAPVTQPTSGPHQETSHAKSTSD